MVSIMDATPIECDVAEDMPFFKEEPIDGSHLSFLFTDDDKMKREGNSSRDRCEEQKVDCFVQDLQTMPVDVSNHGHSISLPLNNIKEDNDNSITFSGHSTNNISNSNDLSFEKISGADSVVNTNCISVQQASTLSDNTIARDITEGKAESLSSTISSKTEGKAESLSSTISSKTEGKAESLSSTILSKTEGKEGIAGSKSNNVIELIEVVSGDFSTTDEYLPTCEQLSLSTDEALINGGEGQLPSRPAPNSRKKRKKKTRKLSLGRKARSYNSKLAKAAVFSGETVANTLIGSVNNEVNLTNNRPKRGRKRNNPSSLTAEVETEDETNNHKEANEVSESENFTQEIQGSTQQREKDAIGSWRMQRKICVRKSVRQTRSTVTKKACKIQTGLENEVLRGKGIRKYSCGVCSESFTQKVLLKKHIAEIHEGRSDFIVDRVIESRGLTFACPLCNRTYARKYGVRRHFARNHLNVKSIPCPECEYHAKNLSDYLKHTEMHKPVEGNAPHFTVQKVEGSQLKCRECHRIFQTNDALRLHVLNHNMLIKLSQTDSIFPSLEDDASNCTCVPNDSKSSTSYTECVVHSSQSSGSHGDTNLEQTALNHLDEELKATIRMSLGTVFKVTSRLDSLAKAVNTGFFSHGLIEKIFQALNCIGSLTTGLNSLSSNLGTIVLTEIETDAKGEDDGENFLETKEDDDDDGKSDSCHEEEEVRQETVDGDARIDEVENLNDMPSKVGLEETGEEEETGEKQEKGGEEEAKGVEEHFEKEEDVTPEIKKKKVAFMKPPKEEKVEEEGGKEEHMTRRVTKRNAALLKSSKENDLASQVKNRKVVCVKHTKIKSKQPVIRGSVKLKKPRKVCKTEEPHDHTCSQCGKVYKNCRSLQRHKIIHGDHRPFKCRLCKAAFHLNEYLRKHMQIHSGDRRHKCDKCNYSAKTAKALHNHSLLHGQDKSFPCEKCSFIGRTVYELTTHEKKHRPCPLCSYEPADVADYNLHKRSHLSFACTECKFTCYSNWQLRRHSKTHRPPGEEDEKFSCELCDYICFQRRQFDYHMARHENKTPYSCPECDYKCSSRTSYEAHRLKHAGLKPFLCSICGASFRRTSYLNNHMLIHKGEKNHKCRICARPFRARYNLKMHEMTHTGEKQFKCHLCNYACQRRKELRLHLDKHARLDKADIEVKDPLKKDNDDS